LALLTEAVPVTAKVGVEEPLSTTELTDEGVMAPKDSVIAALEVGFATVPLIPFAVTTLTLVTIPVLFVVATIHLPVAESQKSTDSWGAMVLEVSPSMVSVLFTATTRLPVPVFLIVLRFPDPVARGRMNEVVVAPSKTTKSSFVRMLYLSDLNVTT
jgi:hypothetical protein